MLLFSEETNGSVQYGRHSVGVVVTIGNKTSRIDELNEIVLGVS